MINQILAIAALCIFSQSTFASLQLTIRTLLVSSQSDGIIRQLDSLTGQTLSLLQGVYPNGTNAVAFVSMTVVNNEVYVSDGFQTLRMNHITGSLTPLFSNPSNGLGSRSNQILAGSNGVGWFDTNGALLGGVLLDTQSAGIDLTERIQDVGWTGQRFSLLVDAQSEFSSPRVQFFEFSESGSFVTASLFYFRDPGFRANGFDIEQLSSPFKQYWVAMEGFDGIRSEVRLYSEFERDAIRTLSLPYAGLSDIVYIVPAPGTTGIALGLSCFALRRRRLRSCSPIQLASCVATWSLREFH